MPGSSLVFLKFTHAKHFSSLCCWLIQHCVWLYLFSLLDICVVSALGLLQVAVYVCLDHRLVVQVTSERKDNRQLRRACWQAGTGDF